LNALNFLVEYEIKNENFKEEEVEVDDKSDLSDDKSFNEDDCANMNEISYESPLDLISAAQEFKKVFENLEKENP
jgi:hypothetical protein